MIELQDVTYAYEDAKAIVGIGFTVQKGEKVALLGSNGSGKSTLLRILAGLYFAQSGTYIFENSPITKRYADGSFRQKIGVLFQNPDSMIISPTVKDEIAFSLREFGREDIEKRVFRIAEAFDIVNLLEKNPLHLSGGLKQRVMIASLLVYEPSLLLFDEPTSAMDPKTTGWFIDTVLETDRTIILATHNLALAYESCDRAIVIGEDHRKAFDGDIEVLFEDLALLEQANLIHKHKHRHKSFMHSQYHLHY